MLGGICRLPPGDVLFTRTCSSSHPSVQVEVGVRRLLSDFDPCIRDIEVLAGSDDTGRQSQAAEWGDTSHV